MVPIHTYFKAESKRIVNGQVVADTAIESEYNGKTLHIDERENGKFKHYNIDDKHLKKLLAKSPNKMNLMERLRADYKKKTKPKKHGTAKHKKHGTAKHGTAKHGTAKHGTAKHGKAKPKKAKKATKRKL